MIRHILLTSLAIAWLGTRAGACCAVTRDTSAVVNADQTVIMIWDAERKEQHFIRQASFASDAQDVGFLVPTPGRPELAEAGDSAFPLLKEITAPRVTTTGWGIGCSAAAPASRSYGAVTVVEEKRVAGFDATVLQASNGTALADWLRAHGYQSSPAVAAWAAPYTKGGWMLTALKVAKPAAGRTSPRVNAAALRLTFKTDRPLFPYREPESATAAGRLGISGRLLRIYFIADARYGGELDGGHTWSGRAAWSGDITGHRQELCTALGLPATTGPATWWLTEFEDRWAYTQAPGDLYFARNPSQSTLIRTASVHGGGDAALLACLAMGLLQPLRRSRTHGHPDRE